jgi:hypothetical protein
VARRIEAFPEAVSEAVRELVDPQDVLRPMLPQALTAIREILESPEDASARLRAAQDLLDRLYGKPIVRQQTELLADIRIVFADASPDAGSAVRRVATPRAPARRGPPPGALPAAGPGRELSGQ